MTFFVLFQNGRFYNVVSTLTNVAKLRGKLHVVSKLPKALHINVEIRNVDSTLFDVANSNVKIQNVVSTFV